MAKEERNPQGITAAALGIAKVFGHVADQTQTAPDFQTAQSMQDIGRKLLISVGCHDTDDVSVAEALAAKDEFIAKLEAIRDRARRTIDG